MDPFVARHRFDRWFWIAFVAMAWFAVAMGFKHQIGLRFSGQADYPAPPALVIHVFAFFGWLTVLTLQVALVETRRVAWHRLLGLSALVLAPVMAWSAIAAEAYSQRFYVDIYPDGYTFFPVPVASVTCFSLSVIAALLLRRRPAWHKRLIYLATSVVLVAAYYRWWGEAFYAAMPPGVLTEWVANYAGVVVLLLVGAGYDLATRGSLHPAFRLGIPLFLAAQLAAVTLGASDWWAGVAPGLLGLP